MLDVEYGDMMAHDDTHGIAIAYFGLSVPRICSVDDVGAMLIEFISSRTRAVHPGRSRCPGYLEILSIPSPSPPGSMEGNVQVCPAGETRNQ